MYLLEALKEREKEIIDFPLTLGGAYEDYPFDYKNWTLMRHKENKKTFSAIYKRNGEIWLNVKCRPTLTYNWRSSYDAVISVYYMNKTHWNTVILNGSVPHNASISDLKATKIRF